MPARKKPAAAANGGSAKRPAATRGPAKKKQPAAVETSESIAEQTAAFLKAGNKVEVVQSGISGQPTLAKPRDAGSNRVASAK